MTRLEQLRLDANLTRQQLSELTNVHGTTIKRIEDGKTAFPNTLAKLSTYFGVKASELVREATPIAEKAA